jgi:hypothetical protein
MFEEKEKKTKKTSVVNEEKEQPGKTSLVSAALYHDFDIEPTFIGTYLHDVIGKDQQDPTKQKVIGYAFADENGEEFVITSAHAVTKALNTEISGKFVKDLGKRLEITFVGKLERAGKPDYNRFKIDLLD